MRLKSFYAKSMREALEMVRNTMGEEAIIIATREENNGKAVRVTAAIEEDRLPPQMAAQIHDLGALSGAQLTKDPFFELTHKDQEDDFVDPYDATDMSVDPESWLQYDEEQNQIGIDEQLTDILLRHSVPHDIMDQIISCAMMSPYGSLSQALSQSLGQIFAFRPLPIGAYHRPIILVGCPGAGKTLAAAKLATRAVMNGLKVGVITTDTVRAGGFEQLQAFTKLLDIHLERAEDKVSLADAVNRLKKQECQQIIIDSFGINPFNTAEVKDLSRLISAADMDAVMVMQAGIDADEAGEIARIFGALGVRLMMPARMDMARRLGGVLSAAYYGGMNLTDVSNTASVADGFDTNNAQNLAARLYPDYESEMKHVENKKKAVRT
jgi:flagellar biosynthesis protein FlhF